MERKVTVIKFSLVFWTCEGLFGCLLLGAVMACNYNLEQKKPIVAKFTSLIVAVYLREFLWNTLNKFPRFLLLNLL